MKMKQQPLKSHDSSGKYCLFISLCATQINWMFCEKYVHNMNLTSCDKAATKCQVIPVPLCNCPVIRSSLRIFT